MDTTKTQAEKLAIAQKTIYEQKVKIVEFEDKAKKAEHDRIKSENQILFKSIDHHQDLIERLKSEIEGLKLQKQSLVQDLSNVHKIKSKQAFEIKDLMEANQDLNKINENWEEKLNNINERWEAKVDKANSEINSLKVQNKNLQDAAVQQEIKISHLNDSNQDLVNKLEIVKSDQIDIIQASESKDLKANQLINNLNDQIQILVDALENEKQKQLKLKDQNRNRVETLVEFETINSDKENQIQDLKIKNQTLVQNSEDLKLQYPPFEALKSSMNKQDTANLLHLACQEGLKDQVEHLLQLGTEIDVQSEHGFTPLNLASLKGHIDIVEILLQTGAKIDAKSKCGNTSLYYASKNGHFDIAKVLLQNGADCNSKNEGDFTPLHLAAGYGFIDVANLLLRNDANVDAKTSFEQWTPLHQAAGQGHTEIVELLLQNGADVDATDRDYKRAPLHYAAQYGHLEVIKILRKYGARTDLKDWKNRTPSQAVGCNL